MLMPHSEPRRLKWKPCNPNIYYFVKRKVKIDAFGASNSFIKKFLCTLWFIGRIIRFNISNNSYRFDDKSRRLEFFAKSLQQVNRKTLSGVNCCRNSYLSPLIPDALQLLLSLGWNNLPPFVISQHTPNHSQLCIDCQNIHSISQIN